MSTKREEEGEGELKKRLLTKTSAHFVFYSIIQNLPSQIFFPPSSIKTFPSANFLKSSYYMSVFLLFNCSVTLFFSSPFLSILFMEMNGGWGVWRGGGEGVGQVFLIEILYTVSMGMANFTESKRKTSEGEQMKGKRGERKSRVEFVGAQVKERLLNIYFFFFHTDSFIFMLHAPLFCDFFIVVFLSHPFSLLLCHLSPLPLSAPPSPSVSLLTTMLKRDNRTPCWVMMCER